MLQPHPHSKMVLWDYPKGKTTLSMHVGETKTFLFTILFLNGTLDTTTYILYKNDTIVDQGSMTSAGGNLSVTLTNLTAGEYWLYTTYTTSNNESIKNTWFVLVN